MPRAYLVSDVMWPMCMGDDTEAMCNVPPWKAAIEALRASSQESAAETARISRVKLIMAGMAESSKGACKTALRSWG